MRPWLVDTGPIVALIAEEDAFHGWTLEQARHAPVVVRTCEAVITESLFLLKRYGRDHAELFGLLEAGVLQCDFNFRDERREVAGLMHRYGDRPMSFADACLVRMAELEPLALVWTLDRDFSHYRKHGRQTLSLIAPW